MGGSWSRNRIVRWPEVRERMRRTSPAEGVGAASQDLGRHGAITSSNTAQTNPDCAWLEAQEDEEVGFPVRPQVPLRPMTFKGAFDLGFFLKEKGGLDGLIYSHIIHEIHDLWVYPPQGYFADWRNEAPGGGTTFPLFFGWCFELVGVYPKDVDEYAPTETNSVLHPMSLHGIEDDEGEVLMWKFDSSLARRHIAREKHPEFYKDC
uniref:Protein Nef n=1 Tax=Human immunodeficiency virus type 1 TaxID=11676 RepID=A0A142FI79_HV1|nr:nef protein [Human immunodeficiency virus 1]